MSRPNPRLTWPLLLILLELFLFAPFLRGLGFYADDWPMVHYYLSAPDRSLPGLIRMFAAMPVFYLRPAAILSAPLWLSLARASTLRHHALLLVSDLVSGLALYAAFRRSTRDEALSFLTACLFIAWPSHESTHFWPSFPPAMPFFAAGLWLHAVWLEESSWPALAGSVFLIAFGSLIYEAVLPLAALVPLLAWWNAEARGLPRLRHVLRACWPAGAAGLAVLAYHSLIQRLKPATLSRAFAFDPRFALKVFGKGFECSFTAWLSVLVSCLQRAPSLGAWWLAAAAGLVLFAWILKKNPWPAMPKPSVRPASWLGGGALLFFAAYLPYALSADRYMPHIFDVQNRVNQPASIAASMLAAFALTLLSARAQRRALAGLLAIFTIIHWQSARDWSRSWQVQQTVLSDIAERSSDLGSGSVVYLDGLPPLDGTAPSFNATWAFDTALKDDLRPDLQGVLWGDRATTPVPQAASKYVYRYADRRLAPLAEQASR